MSSTDWLNNPALKSMNPRKKEILLQLINQADGKSASEAVPLLMATQQQMNAQKLKFTDQERKVMVSILTEKLNPQERQRFEAMQKMLHF